MFLHIKATSSRLGKIVECPEIGVRPSRGRGISRRRRRRIIECEEGLPETGMNLAATRPGRRERKKKRGSLTRRRFMVIVYHTARARETDNPSRCMR